MKVQDLQNNKYYISIFKRKRMRYFEIFISLVLIQSTVLGHDASPEGEYIFLIENFSRI